MISAVSARNEIADRKLTIHCGEGGSAGPKCLSRRQFITSAAALGATQMLPLRQASGQSGTLGAAGGSGPRLIDVHHHLLPPKYIAARRSDILKVSGMSSVLDWTVAGSLDDMDKNGVRTAIVSVSTPGIWVGKADESRALAREINEFAARMAVDHPSRFGFFAAVPLPDTDGSLKEIEYALDTLHADGIGFLTNYDGKYLGDPAFAPIFDELHRRKAVVYGHPTAANCCWDIVPGVAISTEEFGFDTTRTITSLLYSGTLSRCSDIKFIFSHGGGTLPFLAGRIGGAARRLTNLVPHGPDYEFRRLHFDTASVTNAPAMAAILKLVPATQVMFGTDYPWGNAGSALQGLRSLGLSDGEMQAIESGSAVRLLPRWKTAG
jgi:predicted TIM-barrel fold metal-dependent hydrolase